MRLENSMEDDVMPFYYCANCLRLSPALGDITEDLICLVCGLSMDLNKVGRKIIFTKDEAVIRNLVWLTT